jgi:hypothetical protein
MVGTLASFGDRILWGFFVTLSLVGQLMVNKNTVKAIIIHFFSVSNTETKCHVQLLPQLTLNDKQIRRMFTSVWSQEQLWND